jgi:hypothetical protein
MAAVQRAVYGLTDLGVRVLSPADPRVVDQFGDFLFVASDRLRSIGLVEDRHLSAIAASDFVWLANPDGYIGPSAAMEIGYATARHVPVFSAEVPSDLGFRRYVRVIPRMADVIDAAGSHRTQERPGILVDPESALDSARRSLEVIAHGLLGSSTLDQEAAVRHAFSELRTYAEPS